MLAIVGPACQSYKIEISGIQVLIIILKVSCQHSNPPSTQAPGRVLKIKQKGFHEKINYLSLHLQNSRSILINQDYAS